ncbi:T9SS type B sorting domain-containing protein [Flavobacterium pedocola]
MKNQFILSYFLFFTLLTFSQNEANIWYFGRHAGLSFTGGGSPTLLLDSAMNAPEGCAVVSDSSGQLLFYTDGNTVWDRTHTIMPNAALGWNDGITQSVFVLPKPGNPSRYYAFSVGTFSYNPAENHGLMSVEIDMNLRGGLGDEDTSTITQLIPVTCEKITAVKHANGIDTWVIAHEWGNNKFYAYLVSASGISAPVISALGVYYNGSPYWSSSGYLKASPDGTKLMCVSRELPSQLLDFNAATGVISNFTLFYTPVNSHDGYYGVEFSSSGRYLYMTNPWENTICQFDMTAPNVEASKITVYTGANPLYGLQMGPDGKIYVAQPSDYATENNHYLGVINNPEGLGVACDFVPDSVFLGGPTHRSGEGFPNYGHYYYTGANIITQQFCLGNPTSFSISSTQPVLSVSWDFGDGNTSNAVSPSYSYALAGSYNVTATITTANETVVKTKNVVIVTTPVANTITNVSICGNNNDTYNLSNHTAQLLGGQSAANFNIAYFNTQADAVNHTNILPLNIPLSIGTRTFYAKIFNAQNRSCYAITSFAVTLNEQPVANQPSDYVICESAPYNNTEQFDLSTKVNQVLNGQSQTNFSVSFHHSQSDADNDLNPLPFTYTNAAPTETVFVRIENNNAANCFATTSFILKVIQQPTLSSVSDFQICDDTSNDGFALFDLSQKTADVLNGQSSAIFEVKYYLNQTDANNNSNPITTPIPNSINPQQVYYSISAISNSNCRVISSFNLVVNRLPIANQPSAMFVCDDVSNDGKEFFNLSSNNTAIIGSQQAADYTVSYHLSGTDADNDINPIMGNYQNLSNPQTIYARIENNQNRLCFATTSFQIGVYKMPVANQPSNLAVCDDGSNNGYETFDLSTQNAIVLGTQSATEYSVSYHRLISEAQSGINPLPLNYVNVQNPETIYARVENKISRLCYAVTSFQLFVRPEPQLNMTDTYSICEGSSITVTAPYGFSTYLWSNGDTDNTTVISESGNYSVTVSHNYGDVLCSTTKSFVVYNSNIATITEVAISDWTSGQNSISVFVTGDGDYEYSLDGVNYQDSNQFHNLLSGEFTVFVRDKKGCGIETEEVYLLMYPKFFTPNADGFNDFWQIKFANHEPNLSIQIFDRYGKILKHFSGTSNGWDGTFNGQLLPSSDYWFVVTRENGKQYKGHFSLKR